MFVPVPNACGNIVITAQALDNVITVDPGLYQRLEAVLGLLGPNHTYLKLGVFPYIEYIRVTAVSNIPNQLVIERGIDNTTPILHAANTSVEYILTAAAVTELSVAVDPIQINVEGNGGWVDNPEPNVFNITILGVNLTSDNGSIDIADIGVVDGSQTIDLAVNPAMFGVCKDPYDPYGGA